MKKSSQHNWNEFIFICLVAIQFGIQPFLTEKFIPNNIIKSSIVLVQELIKGICCIFVLLLTENIQKLFDEWTFLNSLRVALLPSFIYCTQNVLLFYSYQNLDPLLFTLINQTKIIFACIFLKLILNKSQLQTKRKIFSFLMLFTTSIILSVDTFTTKIDIHIKNAYYGLASALIAAILSGLAGTLAQKALQTNTKSRNSLLFSLELAIYGIVCTLFRLFATELMISLRAVQVVYVLPSNMDSTLIIQYGFLYNFQLSALIPIVSNALGGIGVGLITKYSSVLHKNYSIILGILLAALIRLVLYSQPIPMAMYISLPLVIISLLLNSNIHINIKQCAQISVILFVFSISVLYLHLNSNVLNPINVNAIENINATQIFNQTLTQNISNKSVLTA